MKRNTIKDALVVLVAVLMAICMTACKVEVTELVLSESELTLKVENSKAVTCTVLPEKASDKTVTWTSSDDSVAIVNDAGIVSAVNVGTCDITASSGILSVSLKVTVIKPVDAVVLDKSEITIKEEETFTFTCTVIPNDASEKEATWNSSDTTVVAVDANGTITGIKAGTCTVTVTVGGKSAVANITVKEKGPDFLKLYEGIASDVKYGWSAGEDGSYLSADTNVYNLDDYSNSEIWKSIKEMNKKLGLPDSLTEDMNQTSWSMGRQTKTFQSVGIEVTWTYHPDKGMEVTYKLIHD